MIQRPAGATLEARGVVSGYGAGEVLRGVDVDVHAGEVVAVLGPNGAGKTTLLRTLVGLNKLRRGTVTIDGTSLGRTSPERALGHGVALVPESRGIFGEFTVEENLRVGGYLERSATAVRERLEDAFERFPILRERRSQSAGTLSGGEQQQLAIARALMSDPRILLLDEPSLGLAPLIVDTVMALVRSLADDGRGVLLVEQHVTQALEMADRGFVLAEGRVRMSGQTAQLIDSGLEMAEAYLGGVDGTG